MYKHLLDSFNAQPKAPASRGMTTYLQSRRLRLGVKRVEGGGMTIDDWRVLICEVKCRSRFILQQSTIISRQSSIKLLPTFLAWLALSTAALVHAQDSLFTLRGHDRWVLSVAISPDSKWLVSGSDDQTVRIWNLRTGGPSRTLRRYDSVLSIAISADGRFLVSGCKQTIRVWKLR